MWNMTKDIEVHASYPKMDSNLMLPKSSLNLLKLYSNDMSGLNVWIYAADIIGFKDGLKQIAKKVDVITSIEIPTWFWSSSFSGMATSLYSISARMAEFIEPLGELMNDIPFKWKLPEGSLWWCQINCKHDITEIVWPPQRQSATNKCLQERFG